MEKNLFSSNKDLRLICKNEECSVYHLENNTGDGTMTSYEVFTGITLVYSNFHIKNCPARKGNNQDMLEIYHCKEGRIEWETQGGSYLYLSSGDLMVDSFQKENLHCSFPLKHYHGLTISISIPTVVAELSDIFEQFSIDISELSKQYGTENKPFIMRDERAIEHIFAELYNIPYNIRTEYLKIKVLELLIYLKAIDVSEENQDRPYFYKTQVEKIKSIMELMTNEPENHYTMEELSKKFDLSVSALKTCFKGVYGDAIYTYMRKFRMDMAAGLLTQTEDSVTIIAGKIGYSNSAKFSEAFKSIKGYTPMEYRKIKIHLG